MILKLAQQKEANIFAKALHTGKRLGLKYLKHPAQRIAMNARTAPSVKAFAKDVSMKDVKRLGTGIATVAGTGLAAYGGKKLIFD